MVTLLAPSLKDAKALALLLEKSLGPDTKAVFVAPTFRQSKLVFEALEQHWRSLPLESEPLHPRCGPRRYVDRCEYFCDNVARITFMPAGDGRKVIDESPDVVVLVCAWELDNRVLERLGGFPDERAWSKSLGVSE